MIRCHRESFAKLCESRGYSLADAMPCVVASDGEWWTVDTGHPSYPRKREEWSPIMVGDMVEGVLAAFGVTKERVEAIASVFGASSGCGCGGRQKWLNEAGAEVQRKARAALLVAKRFYVGS